MERMDTILTACASQKKRRHLRELLSERFNLLESANVRQMLTLLAQNADCISTVILGTSVLDQAGQQLLQEYWDGNYSTHVPVVILNENEEKIPDSVLFRKGATDVLDLAGDPYATLTRVETVAELHKYQTKMETLIQERSELLRQSNETVVDLLSSIIEHRSAESGHHVKRIRFFTRTLLEEVMHRCPEYRLDKRTIDIIASASALHDVGKIAIPDAILLKPGPLTPEEWEVMKTHSATGCQILETLGVVTDEEYFKYARNICLYHHERWDGGGYPEGLAGDQIPICAQVVGLADAYEALTADRVYKKKFSFDQAINMILKGECGAFSPKLLACLKNVTESYEKLTISAQKGTLAEEPFDMSLPAPETNISGLERVQAMYYCLVHYIGGFLMEVNLNQGLFHVVYNPYPEFARMENVTQLGQLVQMMLDNIVVPRERETMGKLLREGIPRFVDEDLHRATFHFHHQGQNGEEEGLFEMALLRIGVHGSKRRSLAILLRKMSESEEGAVYKPSRITLPESTYICRNDSNFTLVAIDRESITLAGYTRQEIQENFQDSLIQMIHPEDRDMVREEFSRQLKDGTLVTLEHRVVTKEGKTLWVTNRSRLIMGEDGIENLHCFLVDVTKTYSAYSNMSQQMGRYITTLEKTGTILFDWDMETDRMEFSDTWNAMFQVPPPDVPVREWLIHGSRIHPDDVPLLMDRIANLKSGSDQEIQEIRVTSGQGRYIWCRIQAHADRVASGNLTKVMGVITNIDSEKQKEQVLQDRAERDSLTKLLNKDAARKKITDYLSNYPQGASCAMLIIDLDDFKYVNDQFGHLFGDAVLNRVAYEIKGQFKGQDIICRIGGDEFMVLVRGLTDRKLLEERCRRLIGSFCANLKVQHPGLNISCSIGIALAPEQGKNYYELFNNADQALYRAKAAGKNTYCFYDPEWMQAAYYQGLSTISRRIDSDEEPGLAEDTIVRHAFKLLYSAADVKAAVNEVLAYLGQKMNVSRAYIFENSLDNRCCTNTFEWCNAGIQPEIQNLQNISYDEDIPGYLEILDERDMLYCYDIRELPDPVYNILEPQGIKSMLHCAVRTDGVLRGYIGFDDCDKHRMWTKEEVQMLSFFTEMLSMFLSKTRQQERTASQAQDIISMLDNQNAWIYIIDPETHELLYLNKKARELLPQAQMGKPCYATIQGGTAPCANCPSITAKKECHSRVVRTVEEEKLLFEATIIRWNGKDGCMMTCRNLPKEDLWEKS